MFRLILSALCALPLVISSPAVAQTRPIEHIDWRNTSGLLAGSFKHAPNETALRKVITEGLPTLGMPSPPRSTPLTSTRSSNTFKKQRGSRSQRLTNPAARLLLSGPAEKRIRGFSDGLWLSLVERLNGVQEVVGSNPASPTTRKHRSIQGFRGLVLKITKQPRTAVARICP